MIATIENAMLARLRAAEGPGKLGYTFKTLESFPDDWASYLQAHPEIRCPAAWATFAGAQNIREEDSGTVSADGTFFMIVAGQSSRNEVSSRHGDRDGSPGSYQLAIDALMLLTGQDFGLDITRMKPGRSFQQVEMADPQRKRGISAIAVEMETRFYLEPLSFDHEAPVPFTDFHANWDVPAFGGIDADPVTPGVQLPDDPDADATDHVELEQ